MIMPHVFFHVSPLLWALRVWLFVASLADASISASRHLSLLVNNTLI